MQSCALNSKDAFIFGAKTVPLLNQLKKSRSSEWDGGVAAIQIVLQTSLGSCGLLSEAFSWQLSAKSPSETQRKRERKRKKELSSGPNNLETGSTNWKQHRGTN